MSLPLRYGAFALLAMAANLVAQALFLQIHHGTQAIPLSIAAGTGFGLVSKFILDRLWIFHSPATSMTATVRTLSLYTLTGIATTLLFWAVEYAFHLCFGTALMRYLGGTLGLTVGYAVKYRLDARFVFDDAALASTAASPRHLS